MIARGRVQNGVVVLDESAQLPEGQEVTVLAHGTVPGRATVQNLPPHSVLDVPVVSLGPALRPLTSGDDLLD